jgi:bacterioferritin-associated ferredoxin
MVCFCEDVRAWEIRAELESGYHEPELVKRRTGALTGPCQGKQCLQAFAYLVVPAGDGAVDMPTGRPPLGPIRLGDLVAGPLDAAETDA